MANATRTSKPARRRFRRQIERALARAKGPHPVNVLPNPDGKLIVLPQVVYLWRTTLPDGEPITFGSPSPTLEYSALTDSIAEQWENRKGGWNFVEHEAACGQVDSGCTCHPKTIAGINLPEER